MHSQVQGLKACHFQARVKLAPPYLGAGVSLVGLVEEFRELSGRRRRQWPHRCRSSPTFRRAMRGRTALSPRRSRHIRRPRRPKGSMAGSSPGIGSVARSGSRSGSRWRGGRWRGGRHPSDGGCPPHRGARRPRRPGGGGVPGPPRASSVLEEFGSQSDVFRTFLFFPPFLEPLLSSI